MPTQTCKSLRDLQLKFTYAGVQGHKVFFTHVMKREGTDKSSAIRSIREFKEKVNKYESETGYTLTYGVNKTKDMPYLQMTPKSKDMSIAKLVRKICHDLDKPIKVDIKHKSCVYNHETGRCNLKRD